MFYKMPENAVYFCWLLNDSYYLHFRSAFWANCSVSSFLSVKNSRTVRLKYSVIFSRPEKGRYTKVPSSLKTTLKQNGMKMGIPPEHIPKSLVGYDHTRAYFFTGNFPVEIAYHGEYHLFRFLRKAFCRSGRIPAGPSER